MWQRGQAFPRIDGLVLRWLIHSATISQVPTLCPACFGVRNKNREQITQDSCFHEALHPGGGGGNTLTVIANTSWATHQVPDSVLSAFTGINSFTLLTASRGRRCCDTLVWRKLRTRGTPHWALGLEGGFWQPRDVPPRWGAGTNALPPSRRPTAAPRDGKRRRRRRRGRTSPRAAARSGRRAVRGLRPQGRRYGRGRRAPGGWVQRSAGSRGAGRGQERAGLGSGGRGLAAGGGRASGCLGRLVCAGRNGGVSVK